MTSQKIPSATKKMKASCPDFSGYNNLPACQKCIESQSKTISTLGIFVQGLEGGFFEVMGIHERVGLVSFDAFRAPGRRLQGFNKQRMI